MVGDDRCHGGGCAGHGQCVGTVAVVGQRMAAAVGISIESTAVRHRHSVGDGEFHVLGGSGVECVAVTQALVVSVCGNAADIVGRSFARRCNGHAVGCADGEGFLTLSSTVRCQIVGTGEGEMITIGTTKSCTTGTTHGNLGGSKQAVGVIDISWSIRISHKTTVVFGSSTQQLAFKHAADEVQRSSTGTIGHEATMDALCGTGIGTGDFYSAGTILNGGCAVVLRRYAGTVFLVGCDGTGNIEVLDSGVLNMGEWRTVVCSCREIKRHGPAVTVEGALETFRLAQAYHRR